MTSKNLNPKNKNQLAGYVNTLLIMTGLYRKTFSKNPLKNGLYYCFSIIVIAAYFYYYFATLTQSIREILQGVALELIIPNVGVLVTVTKVSIQVILYSKNKVVDLYDHVSKIEGDVWARGDDDVKKLYLSKIAKGKLFRSLIGWSCMATIVSYTTADAYTMFELRKHRGELNSTVASRIKYNYYFPAERLDNICWVLCLNVLFSYSVIVLNITTHVVIIVLCIASSTHLALLQHRLKNYISEDFTEDKMEETIAELKSIIREHQITIKFYEQINAGNKNIFMMNYILSSVDVAAGAIQLLRMSQTDLDQWVYFYTFSVTMAMFCLAWSANEVLLEGLAVGDAAYSSRWHLLNKEGQQLTHIIMLRSLRPLMMTIGPFGPLTLNSFIVIMKLAYSVLSVIGRRV